MKLCISFLLIIINISCLSADFASEVRLHPVGTDFIPTNLIELRDIRLSISSPLSCARLCHEDPQCRTFVFDFPSCRLYESSLTTGSIIGSSSISSIVGSINYDNINLSSLYNKSCDYCYADRYLLCRNNKCQCPMNSFWDGQSKCLNELFPESRLRCENDNWCRQDLNLICYCGQCQCSKETFWQNEKCVPRLLAGSTCNTSDQCRNDLNLTCSRTNKICTPMTVQIIPVINGTMPAKFSYLGTRLNYSGVEWWHAFDNNRHTYWNALIGYVMNIILVSFDDEYLLSSVQLTVYGDGLHDPKTIDVYFDENGTCLCQSFSFPMINNCNYTTLPIIPFDMLKKPVVARQFLLAIDRWTINQAWIFELTFFGALY